MLCDSCKKNIATIHKTVVVNGEGYETHLCTDCAMKLNENNFSMGDSLFDIMDDLFGFLNESYDFDGQLNLSDVKRCPKCGKSFADLIRQNGSKCDECYNTFNQEIRDAMENMTNPPNLNLFQPEDGELNRLQDEFDKAIAEERYEDAGELKKQINNIKNKGDK